MVEIYCPFDNKVYRNSMVIKILKSKTCIAYQQMYVGFIDQNNGSKGITVTYSPAIKNTTNQNYTITYPCNYENDIGCADVDNSIIW